MDAAAPGRCNDCGNDAYIQLSGQTDMLCAHCYGKRLGLGLGVMAGRKGGEPVEPKVKAPSRRRLP